MATVDKHVTGWVRVGGYNPVPLSNVPILLVLSDGEVFRYIVGRYNAEKKFHHDFTMLGSFGRMYPVAWMNISGQFHQPPAHWKEKNWKSKYE